MSALLTAGSHPSFLLPPWSLSAWRATLIEIWRRAPCGGFAMACSTSDLSRCHVSRLVGPMSLDHHPTQTSHKNQVGAHLGPTSGILTQLLWGEALRPGRHAELLSLQCGLYAAHLLSGQVFCSQWHSRRPQSFPELVLNITNHRHKHRFKEKHMCQKWLLKEKRYNAKSKNALVWNLN